MGVAKPVVLPSIKFDKQGQADEFFKKILGSYEDDEYLNEADEELVFELLQRHPEAETKIGNGVLGIFRAPSPEHPSSCFHVHRFDDSKTDFSYKACVRANTPTLKAQFYEACQRAVAQTLLARKRALFEASNGQIRCYKTGALTTFTSSDYRHTKPRFRDIVQNFIKQKDIKISADMLSASKDLQYSTVFVAPGMVQDFVEYHQSVAELEIFNRYEIPSFS